MPYAVEHREAARRLLAAGQSIRQVAKALAVPKSTVADWKRDFAEDGPRTGVMVAFYLPNDAARQLALAASDVEGQAMAAAELHLTLAYLGDSGGIKDAGRLRRVVAGFAAIAPPLSGEVSGVGIFAGQEAAIYASFDAPQLPEWRQRLVEHLRIAGYPPDTSHGYTPHITLAYATGKTKLEAPELELRFGTLTLALGEDRYDFPLEGTTALFAEAGEPQQPAKPNQPTAPAGAVEPPEGVALEPVLPEPAAPILDQRLLEAWHRYFVALLNGTAHTEALYAAKQIDPDFDVSDDQARRAIHALGRGEEPVRFANWSPGNVAPPDYVQSVYEQFRWNQEQVSDLAGELFDLGEESYLDGLNTQLVKLGRGVATGVEDEGVRTSLRDQARSTAAGIADTFDRDLAEEVYQQWAELRAVRGTQMSRYWLEQAVNAWALQRAEWKAGQIALTEVGRYASRGGREFVMRNRDLGKLTVTEANIVPGVAECQRCVDLIGGNPYRPDDGALGEIPAHPTCGHTVDYVTRLVDPNSPEDLWWAQEGG